MARVNVYMPDSLAEAARAGGLNVSNLTQLAVGRALALQSTTAWLQRVALERVPGVTHETVVATAAPHRPVSTTGCSPGGPEVVANAGTENLVLDASALLDLMLTVDMGTLVESSLGGHILHAPAHVDGEVLEVLGRLEEKGHLRTPATRHLATLAAAPIQRHPLHRLSTGAWRRRADIDLKRAYAVELASMLQARLISTF